jgi:hypothetical protein
MPTARIIEAVDVLEDDGFCPSTGFPRPAPDQLGLDGFEESLDGTVVIVVAFAAYRRLEPVLTHDLLVVVAAVLAAPVAVEDAAARQGLQGDGHLRRPDRQIKDHSQIQPPLAGPDVTDIIGLFRFGSGA